MPVAVGVEGGQALTQPAHRVAPAGGQRGLGSQASAQVAPQAEGLLICQLPFGLGYQLDGLLAVTVPAGSDRMGVAR